MFEVEKRKLYLHYGKLSFMSFFFMTVSGRTQKHIFLSMKAVIYVVFQVKPVQQINFIFPLLKTAIYVAIL